jgi:hypothetical protein
MVDALTAARLAMVCLKRPPAAGARAASRSICARQNYNPLSGEFGPIVGTSRWRIIKNMNEINLISPYKHHGMWVFDDPRVGLLQEPFVAGAMPISRRRVWKGSHSRDFSGLLASLSSDFCW